MNHTPLFAPKYFREVTKHFAIESIPDIQHRKEHIANWIRSIDNGTITGASESELQDDFLKTFFAGVLEYSTKVGKDIWSLDYEFATQQDATHADGYLGFFTPEHKDVRAVIELKDARSDLDAPQKRKNDRRTPVEQAFSYAHKSGANCRWVIVSNMLEVRLYHAGDSTRYEYFRITELQEHENLHRFLYLLDQSRLIRQTGESEIDLLYRQRREQERDLSNEFYERFRDLRVALFSHLVEHNPNVPELDLLAKAQKLLDRIVFVFFCEDTGMLPYQIARAVIKQAEEGFSVGEDLLWQQLRGLFHSIDKGNPRREINKFNGGLFADDPLLDSLTMHDDALRQVLSLEEFDFQSELDVNILGHIFEQSISDIEEMKAHISGHTFDEKKGKRKKEGIVYTPPFITGYIVEKSVGGKLDDIKKELGFDTLPELTGKDYESIRRTKDIFKGNARIEQHRTFWLAYRERVSTITVLDPACGSGAFLVAVFDRLYQEGQSINRALSSLSLGYTTAFDLDKHILRHNLYGVDVNAESVEITKLSLWLKTADKGSELTLLDDRIRVGDSIVNDTETRGTLAFEWGKEFPEVFADGGFDVVVGNPPYVRQELLGDVKNWLKNNYAVYAGTADLYVYFFERGVSLLKPGGIFSIVVANKWMRGNYGRPLREWMAALHIEEILDFGDLPVFQGVTTYPCITTLRKEEPKETFTAAEAKTLTFNDLDTYAREIAFTVRTATLDPEGWALVGSETGDLLAKLRGGGIPLGEYIQGKIYRGVLTGLNEAFVIDRATRDRLVAEDARSAEIIKPFLAGRDIKRYMPVHAENYLIFTRRGIDIEHYQAIKRYLEQYREQLEPRPKNWSGGTWPGRKPGRYAWYEIQDSVDYYAEFEKGKLIYPNICKQPEFTYDIAKYYTNQKCFIISSDDLYLLGLLNSSVTFFLFRQLLPKLRGDFYEPSSIYFKEFPIHAIDEGNADEVRTREEIIERVERIMAINAEREEKRKKFLRLLGSDLGIATFSRKLESWHELEWEEFEKELKKGKITLSLQKRAEWLDFFETNRTALRTLTEEATRLDREIDERVFDLYRLDEKERKIVAA